MSGSRSLLILEDDPDLRMTLEYFLGKVGYDVVTAKNCEEGLKVCLEDRPRAVLCDIMMPGMNGYDFCSKIKGEPVTRYLTKVIFMSARPESEVMLKGPQVCADFFVEKPVDPNDIGADLYILFEEDFDPPAEALSRLRVTRKIPTRKESMTPSYQSNGANTVHLNPPAVSVTTDMERSLPSYGEGSTMTAPAPASVATVSVAKRIQVWLR